MSGKQQDRLAAVDVLIPTCGRSAALAVTLTSLCAQNFRDFRVVVSDQTAGTSAVDAREVGAVLRVLRLHGHPIHTHRHLPSRGMAEHRQFLLDQVTAPYALFLDDDLILEPEVIGRMIDAIRQERCGFVGSGVIGLSYLDDLRPFEQAVEFWLGPVEPELVVPDSPGWHRYRLHNAANLLHVQERLGLSARGQDEDGETVTLKYRVAWVGGCVMYDAAKLRSVGGFQFWRDLPREHCGEDVLAQLRVMARHGGCGLMPSGVYHQELPTTIQNRAVNAPRVLGISAGVREPAAVPL